MMLSSLSNTDVEAVVRATDAPVFFQLYVYRDRGVTEAVLARAEAAGAKALVLTVDAPMLGHRERDVRNRFELPAHLSVRNLVPEGLGAVKAPAAGSGLAAYFAALIDPSLSWRDLEWLRARTRLPLVVKGLVRADDARRAVENGASAVVVSNHGGRQLDGAIATLDALPGVAEAVDGRVPVLMDGGIRRGTDVLKAIALGARAVLVGRPILWGLAVDGEAGARRVLELLRQELDHAMALAGAPTLADLTPDLIRRVG
jgi:4-hydroxymandelate oxidase